MPWKKDENGIIVVDAETGNPIWTGQDGVDAPHDPTERSKQIAELTRKNRLRGEELEAARATLAHFEGIDDVPAFVAQARQDAESVASRKDKDNETDEANARRVQEAVKSAIATRDAEIAKTKAENEKLSGHLHHHVIGNSFLTSQFVAEKCVSPALVQQLFNGAFRMSGEGKLQAIDPSTGDIMYGENGGEASFDEAIATMITKSPFRDNVLKPTPGGSGTASSSGKIPTDKNTMSSVDRIAAGLKVRGMGNG